MPQVRVAPQIVIQFSYRGFPVLCEACAFHFFAVGMMPTRIKGANHGKYVCNACGGYLVRSQALPPTEKEAMRHYKRG